LIRATREKRQLSIPELANDVEQGEHLDLREPERRELGRAIRRLASGASRYLNEVGDNVDVDELVTRGSDGKTPVTILYLNTLNDDLQKQRFSASILARIYGWMVGTLAVGAGPRLLLMFDEVGPFMPPVKVTPTKEWLKRIFQEGRKFGVSGLFCTQSFTNVDYKVLAQANTMAVGKLNTEQEKRRLREIMFGLSTETLGKISSVEHSFLMSNTGQWGMGGKVVVPRMLMTQHRAPPWGESDIERITNTGDTGRAKRSTRRKRGDGE
jgi:hypothetical protein